MDYICVCVCVCGYSHREKERVCLRGGKKKENKRGGRIEKVFWMVKLSINQDP